MGSRVHRISATDHTELLTDVGPVPKHVAALLLIDHPDADALAATLAARLARIDRFRDRLRVPRNRLRLPSWKPDRDWDAARHLAAVPVDECPTFDGLVAAAVAASIEPLPRDRPLWRARILVDPAGRAHGIVVVLHHVLADGLGGLAVLQRLVDDPAAVAPVPTPDPRVSHARPPAPERRAPRGRTRAPVTSVNKPTGPRRAVHVAQADVEALRLAARAAGATINDCLLVAATSALEDVLHDRGEAPRRLVASVLVSTRSAASRAELGNRIGVMAVPVDLDGTLADRLGRIAAITGALKARPRPASIVVGPLLRLLAIIGALAPVIDHQRMVTTFVTNIRGPHRRVRLAGEPVTRIVPITSLAGNVAVAFAALSYAGRLEVSIVTDPDVIPEGVMLARAVEEVLTVLAT